MVPGWDEENGIKGFWNSERRRRRHGNEDMAKEWGQRNEKAEGAVRTSVTHLAQDMGNTFGFGEGIQSGVGASAVARSFTSAPATASGKSMADRSECSAAALHM